MSRPALKLPRCAVGVCLGVALLVFGTPFVGAAAAAHVGCGAVITADTTLHSDIGPCPGNGLIVSASNIKLDLNGHTVSGDPEVRESPDKAGILLLHVTGVSVGDGTVQGFDGGLVIRGGGDHTIRRLTALDNVNYRIVTSRDSQPSDIVSTEGPFCEFGDGIAIFNSSSNEVRGNDIVGNGPFSGIALVGNSDDNFVSANRIFDNDVLNQTSEGWATTCGSDITGPNDIPSPVFPGECCASSGRQVQDVGVRIEGPGAERNLIERNRIIRSGLMGVMVHGNNTAIGAPSNSYNVIRDNTISETAKIGHDLDRQGHGIYLHHPGPSIVHAPHHTTIEGNTSSGNYGGGIFLDSKGTLYGTIVRDNTVANNGLDGIHVLGAGSANGEPNVITNNRGGRNGHRAEEVNEGPDFRANYFGTDGADTSDGCIRNIWSGNQFGTVNQPCVAANGTGVVVNPSP